VSVLVQDGRCIATVADTGVGLRHEGTGGSGLANLRERMKLAFGDAQLKLSGNEPRGTRAVLDYPAQVRGTA
jgi:LytS/YehU family sensor histidine kinase